MALKAIYASEAELPAELKAHYKATDGGKFILDIEGNEFSGWERIEEFRNNNRRLKTENDDRLSALKGFEDVGTLEDFKHLKDIRDQLDESKLIRSNKLDEAVGKRVETMKAEHEKELKKIADARDKLNERLSVMMIDDATIKEAIKLGARESALEDIVARMHNRFRVEDGKLVGFKPDGSKDYGKSGEGVTILEVLEQIRPGTPHLWKENTGAGGEPGKTSPTRTGVYTGPNPWKKETSNLTKRMDIERKDPQLAKRLREEAGIVRVPA